MTRKLAVLIAFSIALSACGGRQALKPKPGGGTPPIPQSITTKLKPQTPATRAASRQSRRFTRLSLTDMTRKHQRTILHLIT